MAPLKYVPGPGNAERTLVVLRLTAVIPQAAPPTPEIQNAWFPGRWIVKREDEGSLASPIEVGASCIASLRGRHPCPEQSSQDTPGWDGPKWLARREEEGSLVSPTEVRT